ncbi:MAG: DNA-3-methyladenine glycosylase 2 family protein [Nanoarchaeota archaeon]|nr:DNA-3-methyladenine glycosylase 2 family protein [Nanoarchaeota archaeon]
MFEKEIEELKKDEKLREVIDKVGEINFEWSETNHFKNLVQSIVYQQLAGKAAKSIWKRVKERTEITPEQILKNDLTGTGLSQRKISYMKDLASKFETFGDFSKMGDEEVINELTRVKGIGKWTAEMFLMFSLKRLNIFSKGDYGLRKAIQKLHNLPAMPKEKEIDKYAKNWAPYKTIASLYLWRWLD